ncbi:hypothetical protein EV426DRAFT_686853 [Tirmania nivea]|nr:hypothetical protein EV426DRAFT_686853 [Tirmania nivea]
MGARKARGKAAAPAKPVARSLRNEKSNVSITSITDPDEGEEPEILESAKTSKTPVRLSVKKKTAVVEVETPCPSKRVYESSDEEEEAAPQAEQSVRKVLAKRRVVSAARGLNVWPTIWPTWVPAQMKTDILALNAGPDHIGNERELAVGENEFPRPLIEVLKVEPTNIYPLELMDIEQQSIDGNLRSILKLLTKALGYTPDELMNGLFLVGGDQLLLDRVRSIQLLRDGDVPGEDFQFVFPVLGPLHTLMNKKKLIMRHHHGMASDKGSLTSFNKVLKRDRKIDDQAKDLWACIDLTRDSLDAVLLGLLMEETGKEYLTFASFKEDVLNGEILWRELVQKVCDKLDYVYIKGLRSCEDSMRDWVQENILLVASQEVEFRAFYTSMRQGDVGAMELLLELWCPQFLAGQQNKYGNELLDIRCGMLAEWSEELKKVVRANWVINPWGKRDKWLGLDEMMEELVRALKEQFTPGGSDDP